MPKPDSKHRELTAIVKDLWDAMLGEPGDPDDRRVDVRRAQENGRRAADRYLKELVAALDLGSRPDRVEDFPYFSLSYDPVAGWGATLRRFARSGNEARAEVEARAADVASQLETRAEASGSAEPAGDGSNGEAEPQRQDQPHAEQEARAKAALERVQEAISRIDRIRV